MTVELTVLFNIILLTVISSCEINHKKEKIALAISGQFKQIESPQLL